VESAVEQPFAGWIDAIRVADPLLVAYGRGRTREFRAPPARCSTSFRSTTWSTP